LFFYTTVPTPYMNLLTALDTLLKKRGVVGAARRMYLRL